MVDTPLVLDLMEWDYSVGEMYQCSLLLWVLFIYEKIQWIVCIIAILTNKCLWFTIISNIKWKKHFVWFFLSSFSSIYSRLFMSALIFVWKQSIFFVHLLPCLMFGFRLQLSSHILFEVCASFLRFHLLIFVLIYRNLYSWSKNQYAQCSKSFFFPFLAVCTSLGMKNTGLNSVKAPYFSILLLIIL